MVATSVSGWACASLPSARKPSTPAVRRSTSTGSLRYRPVAESRKPLSPSASVTGRAGADAPEALPPARNTTPASLAASVVLTGEEADEPIVLTKPSLNAKRASICAGSSASPKARCPSPTRRVPKVGNAAGLSSVSVVFLVPNCHEARPSANRSSEASSTVASRDLTCSGSPRQARHRSM